MLIKYDPSQLLHTQLISNTLTQSKLNDKNNEGIDHKQSIVHFAPIFVAGLQVNVSLQRTYLGGLNRGDHFHLEDESGNDLAKGKVIDPKNVDTFFRELHAERLALADAPRPNSP